MTFLPSSFYKWNIHEKDGTLKLNQVSDHEEKNPHEYSICSTRFSNLFYIPLQNSKGRLL